MKLDKWKMHLFELQYTATNSLILMDYRSRFKKNNNLYFCTKKLLEFLFSRPALLICVCGVWATVEAWQPVGWAPAITSQISASPKAHMGYDKKFCSPLGCNYPAGCSREWPPLLWHLLNPDLMSGLISKFLSAMPTPRPSTVDSEPP